MGSYLTHLTYPPPRQDPPDPRDPPDPPDPPDLRARVEPLLPTIRPSLGIQHRLAY